MSLFKCLSFYFVVFLVGCGPKQDENKVVAEQMTKIQGPAITPLVEADKKILKNHGDTPIQALPEAEKKQVVEIMAKQVASEKVDAQKLVGQLCLMGAVQQENKENCEKAFLECQKVASQSNVNGQKIFKQFENTILSPQQIAEYFDVLSSILESLVKNRCEVTGFDTMKILGLVKDKLGNLDVLTFMSVNILTSKALIDLPLEPQDEVLFSSFKYLLMKKMTDAEKVFDLAKNNIDLIVAGLKEESNSSALLKIVKYTPNMLLKKDSRVQKKIDIFYKVIAMLNLKINDQEKDKLVDDILDLIKAKL